MQIYKQYNGQQLNDQYNNRLHVPGYATYFERWEKLSSETREKHHFIKDIPYGDLPRERLDVFPSDEPNSKTLVFIHGGYWQMFNKASFHFIAGAFHAHHVTTVFINYPLAPTATIDQITASCRKAMLWLHQNIGEFNGDPDQLFVAGHSAGAHLAAMLMEKDWVQNNAAHFIKGIVALSGVFNLAPIMLTANNAVLNMTEEMVKRNSPAELIPTNTCPLLLFVGEDETDEFKDQSMELYNKWKDKNNNISLMQLPGIHHFSIPETLAQQSSPVHIAVCKMMGI